jgi:hypothetical protein
MQPIIRAYDFEALVSEFRSKRVYVSWRVDINYGAGVSSTATKCSKVFANYHDADNFLIETFSRHLNDLL